MTTINLRSCTFHARAWLAATALAALALLSGCATTAQHAEVIRTPKNIIILFGDGAAATQWELGRYTSRALRGQSYATTDVVFREGSVGMLTVHSANAFVTDSAAAATAMSIGLKTNNGMIGVTPD